MSARFICDACGLEAPAFINPMGDVFKPSDWFTRYDKESGRQDVCSRPCIDALALKTGVTRVVIPL